MHVRSQAVLQSNWRTEPFLGLVMPLVAVSLFCFCGTSGRAQAVVPSESMSSPAIELAAIDQILTQASSLAERCQYAEALQTIERTHLADHPQGKIRAMALTKVAMIQFSAGHMAEAIQASETIIHLPDVQQLLDGQDLAFSYFILGAGYIAKGQYEKAEQAYLRSLTLFSQQGKESNLLSARVYSDLSLLYLQWGQGKKAEEILAKSAELERKSDSQSKMEQVFRLDALAHLQAEQGRVSDAVKTIQFLVEAFGSDASLSAESRAHLYWDEGVLCYSIQNLEESADHLRKSIALVSKTPDTPETALVLATLGQVQLRQKNFAAAEASLHEAEIRMQPFRKDYPVQAAQLAVTLGAWQQSRKRWQEARTQFLQAIGLLQPVTASTDLRLTCLRGAVTANHHLGNKIEEKSLHRQIKQIIITEAPIHSPRHTVDVLTLRKTNSRTAFNTDH